MRAFYLGYAPEQLILPQAVRELPAALVDQLGAELDGKNVPASAAAVPWGHIYREQIHVDTPSDFLFQIGDQRPTLDRFFDPFQRGRFDVRPHGIFGCEDRMLEL